MVKNICFLKSVVYENRTQFRSLNNNFLPLRPKIYGKECFLNKIKKLLLLFLKWPHSDYSKWCFSKYNICINGYTYRLIVQIVELVVFLSFLFLCLPPLLSQIHSISQNAQNSHQLYDDSKNLTVSMFKEIASSSWLSLFFLQGDKIDFGTFSCAFFFFSIGDMHVSCILF